MPTNPVFHKGGRPPLMILAANDRKRRPSENLRARKTRMSGNSGYIVIQQRVRMRFHELQRAGLQLLLC